MTAHDFMLIAERLGQGMNFLGHRLLVVTRHRLGRLAKPAQVRGDHCMTLCQLNHQRPPHVTILGIAVQQNYWVALSSDQIMKSNSVDVSKPIFDPLLRMNRKTSSQRKDQNCRDAIHSTDEHFHLRLSTNLSFNQDSPSARRSRLSNTRFGAPSRAAWIIARPNSSVVITAPGAIARTSGRSG